MKVVEESRLCGGTDFGVHIRLVFIAGMRVKCLELKSTMKKLPPCTNNCSKSSGKLPKLLQKILNFKILPTIDPPPTDSIPMIIISKSL